MTTLRFWNKSFGKAPFKRISEQYFKGHNEQNEVGAKYFLTPSSACVHQLYHKTTNVASSSFLFSFLNHTSSNDLGSMLYNTTTGLNSLSSASPPLPFVSDSVNQSSFSSHPIRYYSTDKDSQTFNTAEVRSDEEAAAKAKQSVLESMGMKEESEGKGDQSRDNNAPKSRQDSSRGEKDENENKETPFLRSQRYAKWMLLATIGVTTPVFVLNYGAPKYDESGNEIKDKYSESNLVLAYLKRAWSEIKVVKSDIVEPSSKKLLPDPLQEPYYQPPYTLVIELMDVFLRPVYDSVTGWRFKKRPGIEYFLSQVGPPLFEVVIFTRETGMTAFPLIESMDQKGYIMYRLFRDAARYKSGFSLGNPFQGEMPRLDPYYQKDLTYLNRDLSKVILVDCDKRAFEKQPENGLCLEKWDGSSGDTTLYDLAGLLRTIATSNVEDVRPVLQHYAESDKPIETFKLAQARMQQESQHALRGGSSTSQFFAGAGNTVSSFIRRR